MSRYLLKQTGNASAASSWDIVGYEATAHASNATADAVGEVNAKYSDTLPARSLSKQATGALCYLTSTSLNAVWRLHVKLQEFDGVNWNDVASGSMTIDSGFITGGALHFFYVPLSTPYTYTTTTANRYRYKWWAEVASGTGGLLRFRSSSSGSTIVWTYAVEDNPTSLVPGSGDTGIIIGDHSVKPEVTIDTDITIGNYGGTTASSYGTADIPDLLLEYGGKIKSINGATLTIRGMCRVGSGEWNAGTEASPLTSGGVKVLQNGVTVNYGIDIQRSPIIKWYGLKKTHSIRYLSGTGSSGNHLFTDGDTSNWAVGDRVHISGASYNQGEWTTISVKHADDEFELTTPLVNTHNNGCFIGNFTRGFKFEGESSTLRSWFNIVAVQTHRLDADVKLSGLQFDNCGGGGSFKGALTPGYTTSNVAWSLIENISFYNYASNTMLYLTSSIYPNAVIREIVSGSNNGSTPAFEFGQTGGLVEDITVLDPGTSNPFRIRANKSVFNNIIVCNFNSTNNATIYGLAITGNANVVNNYIAEGGRQNAILISAGVGNKFYSPRLGVVNPSTNQEISCSTGYSTNYFYDLQIGATTAIANWTNLSPGSKVVFDTFNGDPEDMRVYSPYGVEGTSGAGLTKTETHTTGKKSWYMSPNSTTNPLVRDFYFVLPDQNLQADWLAFYFQDASITEMKIDLFLFPKIAGNDTPDATYTMSEDGTWVGKTIDATYTNGEPRLATARVSVKGASGTAYVADIFNGGNKLTDGSLYFEGEPSPVMVISQITGAELWSYTKNNPISGSMGEAQVNTETSVTDNNRLIKGLYGK